MFVDTYQEFLDAVAAVEEYERKALGYIKQHLAHHYSELKITPTFDALGSYIELLRLPLTENEETPVRIVKWFSVDPQYPQAFIIMVPSFVFDGVLMDEEEPKVEPTEEADLSLVSEASPREKILARIYQWIHIHHPYLQMAPVRHATGGCFVSEVSEENADGLVTLRIDWWEPTSREPLSVTMPASVLNV